MTQPFRPGELDGVDDLRPDELVADTRVARELEAIAGPSGASLPADFVDRVMAAVEIEPLAAPATAAGHALRHGAIGAFLASFADAWRVATRSGFPVSVRAQAFALVLVVAGLAAGSGVAAAGALGFMNSEPALPSPRPSLDAAPSPDGESTPSVAPTPSPSTPPPASAEPTETAEAPSEPPKTAKPDGTDGGHDGGGGGASGDNGGQRTPRPTRESGGSDGSGGDDGGDDRSGSDGGSDDHSGSDSETQSPSETPDDGGSGSGSGSGGD